MRGGAGETAIGLLTAAVPIGARYLKNQSYPQMYVPEPFIGPFIDSISPSKELEAELNKAKNYMPRYYTKEQEKTRADTFWNKEKAGIKFQRSEIQLEDGRLFQDVDKTAVAIDKKITDAAKNVYGSVQGVVSGTYPRLRSGVNAAVSTASNAARSGVNYLRSLSPQRRSPFSGPGPDAVRND